MSPMSDGLNQALAAAPPLYFWRLHVASNQSKVFKLASSIVLT